MTDGPSPVQTRSGSFEDALAHGRRLLDQDPSAALKQAEELVRLRKDARVFRLAAAACRKLGMPVDAEGAELGAIEASLREPELSRSAEALADGRDADAREIATNFLQTQPDDLLAMTIAAEASLALREFEVAEKLLDEVLERAPTFLRASMLLASCLAMQVRMREAITVVERVVARKPHSVPALSNLARLLAEVGDGEKATEMHERLVALDRSRPERWEQLAHSYRIVGRREDSIEAFRRALAIEPSRGSSWWAISNYFPTELGDQDRDAITAALAQRTGKQDEGALWLALGHIADRAGEYAEAFEYFRSGKAARLVNQPYDPDPISTAVSEVIKLYTPGFYRQRSGAGWQDSSPIFVIGMHRSGTTMVERMLGRHSAIEGAGEMRVMPKLAECARREADNPEHYAELLANLPDEQLTWVGKRYVEASRDYRRSEKRHFIDKNNLNWLQAGLTLIALPDARIIDVRRNALDCCWANFKMLFSAEFPATNELRHVGQLYRDYVRLFDAMQVAAPGRILSVRYEQVVDDLEGQARRMLDFVGLPFEPQCLDFHLSTGAVATASSEQVRQPLNRKGIGSAEPYRQWLGPLIEELGELAG